MNSLTPTAFSQVTTSIDDFLSKPIAYHPNLVRISGSAAAGLILSQLLYWSKRPHSDAAGWIYNSEAEWSSKTGLTPTEQRRARRELKARGLIEEKHGRFNKLNFRLCWERLEALLSDDALCPSLPCAGVRKRTQNLKRGRICKAQVASSVPAAQAFSRISANQFPENRRTNFPKIGELTSRKSAVLPHKITPKITSETTHTRAAQSPTLVTAQNESVCVKSKFTLDERRRHADQNQLGRGWLVNSGDGRYDKIIEIDFNVPPIKQAESGEKKQREVNQCPQCHGSGWWYPAGMERGVAKCTHETQHHAPVNPPTNFHQLSV